jgi:hypothetical protein
MKKIKFAGQFSYIDKPKKSARYLPEWYKNTPPVSQKGASLTQDVTTFKTCVPFMDSMTSGYIIELWADIEIKKINGVSNVFWKDENVNPMSFKTNDSIGFMSIPEGYGNEVFSFMHSMYLETPKGYSLIFTQPLNRFDLPFLTLSAIVDCDLEPLFPGGVPMFLKKDFEGVIKKGTPLIQVIPIKRDSWKIEDSQDLKILGKNVMDRAGLYIRSWYKKNAWSRKSYE